VGLVLLALVGASALFVQVWYFRPFSIDLFFEREFIRLGLRNPEGLTQLGALEQFGIHGHNAKLTDASPAFQEEMSELRRKSLETLHRYDRSKLDEARQLSYDILDWSLQDSRAGHRWMYHDYPVNQLEGAQVDLPELMTDMQQVASVRDARDYIARLSKFGVKFDQVLESLRLRESKRVLPPRIVVDKTLEQMRGFVRPAPEENLLHTALRKKLDALPGLPQGERESLLTQARSEIEGTVYPAYRKLIAYFEGLQWKVTENNGVWALPEGDAYYAYLVRHHTTTGLAPEQVHGLGLAEVARIEGELDAILKGQGLAEGTIGQRLRRLNQDPRLLYPNTDEGRAQALSDYQRIVDEINRGTAAAFDIRPRAAVKVERVPAFKEKTAQVGYYNPPAMDGSRPGVFSVNLYDMNELPKFGMRSLSYHEAVPGHHLQIAIAYELKGVPSFRKLLPFTAYTEGWALYAERLAWEMGYQKDPFDNLGRLRNEMLRAVRLVVDSGIHHKRWTREQAIAYLSEKSGLPQSDVITEVDRYLVWPGQALAYKTGMLKILELRARAKTELGAKFDLKQFHNVVLGSGAMPLAILEQQVDRWIARTRASSRRSSTGSKLGRPAPAERPAA
jgi:uncharacterized protein (DUF885 family)